MMEAEKVFARKSERGILVYESLDDMERCEGTREADAEFFRDDWEAADFVVREEGGGIVLGLSDAEKGRRALEEAAEEARKNLLKTDWIAYKLAEAAGDAEAYGAMRRKYAVELELRSEWRAAINAAERANAESEEVQ